MDTKQGGDEAAEDLYLGPPRSASLPSSYFLSTLTVCLVPEIQDED